MRHHDLRGIVVLVVLDVQKGELLPVLLRLAHADKLGDVDARGEELEVLHQLLGLVLGVEAAQLREDAHVRALKPEPRLHKRKQRLKLAVVLVELADLLQLVRLHDDVEAAQLGQPELALLHARKAHLLPCARAIGLAGGLNRLLELVQADQRGGQAPPGADARVQDLGRLIQLFGEAEVAGGVDVGGVGRGDELLQLAQLVGLGQRVHQLRVHLQLLHLLAHHVEIRD
mmetsp:Transcript_29787/g.50046  ORF Transcript_29787/g.50046 Transcript_29787/m.50046 type:complete len:229 (+) Transcript_29787:1442-2128(+)